MVTGGVGERRIRLDRTQEQATTMSVHQAFYIRAFANLSGSLLLAGILVGLVAGSAALWLVGRGRSRVMWGRSQGGSARSACAARSALRTAAASS